MGYRIFKGFTWELDPILYVLVLVGRLLSPVGLGIGREVISYPAGDCEVQCTFGRNGSGLNLGLDLG